MNVRADQHPDPARSGQLDDRIAELIELIAGDFQGDLTQVKCALADALADDVVRPMILMKVARILRPKAALRGEA